MAVSKDETYNNLIDLCIEYELNPDYSGNIKEIFRRLLADYFFRNVSRESKNLENFFNEFEVPAFLDKLKSLQKIDMDELSRYVGGSSINDSLAGRIMLTKRFLRAFYPNQTPEFNALSEDSKFELIEKIKNKNENIINAFEKMKADKMASRERKIITLVSLILRNIHKKSGRPLNRLNKPAVDIINSIFPDSDNKFVANSKQMARLSDDSNVKELVKAFFVIKQYKDIDEMSGMFKNELERFRKRALWSA